MAGNTTASRWDRAARVQAVIALLVAGTAAGCASASQRSTDDQPLEIRVRNNLMPPTSLSISLLPSSGARSFVGLVAPSQTKTLEYDFPAAAGMYRLLAEATDGSALASRAFVMPSDNGVEWDLALNQIWTVGGP